MTSHIAQVFDYNPVRIVKGKGSFLWDKKGKKYLDLVGGWCVATVGWAHPGMARAIAAQGRRGLYIPALFHDDDQEVFAKELCRMAPGKMNRAIRCTSGSEAVEFAIKCARAATGKQTVVSIGDTWHGHTYGAASLGYAWQRTMAPRLPGFVSLPLPKTDDEARKVVKQFEKLCRRRNIAAFMSEPIWTNAGCFIPPADFYPAIERVCRKHGVLLVMDEVATGVGRTGKMFASEWWGIEPDIICLGKSFTGGYATMAATLVTERVWRRARGIPVYATFGWLAQDLAAVRENVRLIRDERLVENSRRVGAELLKLLEPLKALKQVKEVRGIGMVFAIEFKRPIAPLIFLRCVRRGALVAFSDSRTLFFSPPLSLSSSEARQAARILHDAVNALAL